MCRHGSADDPPAGVVNDLLAVLFGELEAVLAELRSDSRGHPLFHVEAELRRRPTQALPGVRFTDEYIRKWAQEISS